MEWLKDGIVLCKLVNKINKGEPDYKKKWKCKFSKSKMPFTQRENICNYIETCKRMGMKEPSQHSLRARCIGESSYEPRFWSAPLK